MTRVFIVSALSKNEGRVGEYDLPPNVEFSPIEADTLMSWREPPPTFPTAIWASPRLTLTKS